MTSELNEGYTTGTHATCALMSSLLAYLNLSEDDSSVETTLPNGKLIKLNILESIKKDDYAYAISEKSPNNDIDVTQGCLITCWCSENIINIPYNPHEIEHTPISFDLNDVKIFIYAGKGIGVATSDILTLKKSFPAINSVPLNMMKREIDNILAKYKPNKPLKEINFVFEVKDGEKIATQTINAKLGIIGGISIIGKTGIVKPISTYAFLHSIYAQIDFAIANKFTEVFFTVGNDSFDYAKAFINEESLYIIDIGNFIFDSLSYICENSLKKLSIVIGIGKLTKVCQGKKNTNNKFGTINFVELSKLFESYYFNHDINTFAKSSTTIKAIETYIARHYPELLDKFYELILLKAEEQMLNWLKIQNSKIENVQIILLIDKNKAISKTIFP